MATSGSGESPLPRTDGCFSTLAVAASWKTSASTATTQPVCRLSPGTALKGVLSTWACWEANLIDDARFNEGDAFLPHRSQFNSPLPKHILGDDSKEGSEYSGDIIFVGGFPAEPHKLPRLELDIVTPHPDNGRGRILPNLFLAWASDSIWEFVFYARPEANQPGELLRKAADWLIEALTTTGLGAKTAAGYGRFRRLNDQERKRIEDQAKTRKDGVQKVRSDAAEKMHRATLPPEERAFEEYAANQKDWVAAAREIAVRPEQERHWILRYFRSAAGQALLKTWTNEKGLKRVQALKQAGL